MLYKYLMGQYDKWGASLPAAYTPVGSRGGRLKERDGNRRVGVNKGGVKTGGGR